MLLLILIKVQYLQNAVFSFEKGLNDQNHSSSDSYHPIKKPPPSKISHPPTGWGGGVPLPLNATWKTLKMDILTKARNDLKPPKIT